MTERFVIDASAWIEYLRGSTNGVIVKTILSKKNQFFTSPVTCAEVYSKLMRDGKDYSIARNAILSNSVVFPLIEEKCVSVAEIHSKEKQKNPKLSLADAFVLELGSRLDAKIVTTDQDFKVAANVLLLH